MAADTAGAATSSEVKDVKREARDLMVGVAGQALGLALLMKRCSGVRMRYPTCDKLEITRLIER